MFESTMVGPKRGWVFVLLSLTALAFSFATDVSAQEADTGTIILDTAGFWRCHYNLNMPVVRKGEDIAPLHIAFKEDWQKLTGRWKGYAKWLERGTPFPPQNWTDPDFDDSSWCRMSGELAATVQRGADRLSPYMALECRRGKFRVNAPARVKKMTLSLEFRGGVIVTLNGKEVRRAYLPENKRIGLGEPAQDYKADERPTRTLTDVDVPVRFLRKGVNILTVEVHRAPNVETDIRFKANNYPPFRVKGAKCGLKKFRLEAPSTYAGALVPNVTRPKGIQAWNSKAVAADFDLDYGDPNEELKPVTIVGTRNGVCSGKIIVGSNKPIRGLDAAVSNLVRVGGKGSIPATRVKVRYATPNGYESLANCRYLAAVNRFDGLSRFLPKEVPIRKKQQTRLNLRASDMPLVFGAVVPVWVMVKIPRDAVPGDYKGTLTIRATGERDIEVSIRLRVCAWELPDPWKFQTFVEIIQSPESVAMRYDVPFWSEKHFQLIESSLKLLGQVGSKTAYIPLICETNLGNAETMVRWIDRGEGSYRYDFSIMDRYLDLVEKHQGKPAVVCFYVWDTFLGPVGGYRWGQDRFKAGHTAYGNRGPEVSLLDPGTGKVTKLQLPRHADPRSVKLWRPLLVAVRDRMKKRGWENVMTLGLVSDRVPRKETIAFFKEVLPKIPWAGNSHVILDKHRAEGLVLKYQSEVYDGNYVPDPSGARFYGWKSPGRGRWRNIDWVAQFPRALHDGYPLTTFRFLGEINLLSGYFGFARMGADFWPVSEPGRARPGRRVRYGKLSERYPKSSWSQLNIKTTLLEPGKNGAVTTARFEMLREGLQQAEARIFIEQTLDNKALRARLGEGLVKQCREVLDDRTRTIVRAVNPFIQDGDAAYYGAWATSGDCWWQAPGVVGYQWYLGSDWQECSAQLYEAAAQVAQALDE